MKVLVTGFGPFGDVAVNPSAAVAAKMPGLTPDHVNVVCETLPVEYAASTARLDELIDAERPDAVVCLGVAATRDEVSVERIARRVTRSQTPDNAGVVSSAAGHDGEPEELPTTLPVDAIAARGVSVSEDAGGYVCDHLFYRAVRTAAAAGVPFAGFVHIPLPQGGWTLESIGRRVAEVIEVVEESCGSSSE